MEEPKAEIVAKFEDGISIHFNGETEDLIVLFTYLYRAIYEHLGEDTNPMQFAFACAMTAQEIPFEKGKTTEVSISPNDMRKALGL